MEVATKYFSTEIAAFKVQFYSIMENLKSTLTYLKLYILSTLLIENEQ
jgi:hypothetical protein